MKRRFLAIITVIALLLPAILGSIVQASDGQEEVPPAISQKVSALLSMQVSAKVRALNAGGIKQSTPDGVANILEVMQEEGLELGDLSMQRIFLHGEQELSPAQFAELEALGLILYPDSWIPPLDNHPTGFLLADMPVEKLEMLAGEDFVIRLDTAERILEAQNDLATQAMRADDVWSSGYDGTGVTIAVLDSGIDLTHPDFPTPVATKDYHDYPILDNTVANYPGGTGHGTHVAGSALGRGTQSAGVYKGSAPDADLVFLKIGGDTSTSASTAAIVGAVRAAVDIYNADVVTMSYGGWGAYHDGSSQEAQAFDYAVSKGAVALCSAGNDANDDDHYSGTVPSTSSTDFIQIDVTGSTGSNAGLKHNLVWYDGLGTSRDLELEYYDSSYTLLPGPSCWQTTQSESSRGTESEYSGYGPSAGSYYYLLSGDSTYYLKVKNNSSNPQQFHIYDDTGKSAVTFHDPDPFYTIGSPADADNCIAVGAYTTRSGWYDYNNDYWTFNNPVDQIAPFSSRGPRVDGGASSKPSIVAPGSAILSCRDDDTYPWVDRNVYYIDNDAPNHDSTTDNDGVGPANYYQMQGTSMACPHAAGVAALILEKNPSWAPGQVQSAMESTAVDKGDTGRDDTYGYGLIDAFSAVSAGAAGPPDISVSPSGFEVTLPPDTTWDGTLNVANLGDTSLIYDITDEDTIVVTAPAPAGNGMPLFQPENMAEGLNDALVQAPSPPGPQAPAGEFGAGYHDALKYDDGTAEEGWAWNPGFEGNRFAVRFTPLSYPATLETAWVNIYPYVPGWNDNDHEQFEVEVWDDDGGAGSPGTMLGNTTATATTWGWKSVDISGMGISITEGDFYVAYRQMTVLPDCEGLSSDTSSPDGRSWLHGGASWITVETTLIGAADFMIRCEVGTGCTWLSESPDSGTVAPSGSDAVTVSIDSTGLVPGDYNADIVITSNDPDENPTTVPVILHVVSAGGEIIDVLSVDPTLFCKIWAYVSVNTSAGMAGELTADDFTIYEDGVEQTLESFEFTSNATAKLDILFVFDDTGSMGGEITGMKNKVQDLTDEIESAGIDARYALISFKDIPEIDQDWTSDATVFKSAVDALVAAGGDDEPEDNLDALNMGLGLGFRPAAQKVIIDITDAHTHYRGDGSGFADYTMPEVASALSSSGVSLFVISPDFGPATVLMDNQGMEIALHTSSPTDNDKKILAEDVGGVWLDINSADFDEILDRIVGVLTSAYHLDYTTSNCVNDCTERTVQIVVNDPVEGTDSDTGTYIAPCGECKVLFEQAHSPAGNFITGYFTMEDLYSDWATLLESQGMTVESINTGTVTYAMLSGYGVVVIPESTDTYLSSEIDAIKQYVNNGGGLLILGELGSYVASQGITVDSIATEFDISFNDNVVLDSSNNDGEPYWPLIPYFDNSVIGADVSNVAYIAGCSLQKLGPDPFPIAQAYGDAVVSSPPAATAIRADGVEMGTAGETVAESGAAELEAVKGFTTIAGAENQSAVAGSASFEPEETTVVPLTGSIKTGAGDAESYIFTVSDVVFFSYEDGTDLELFNSASTSVWSGTLNKGEHHYQTVPSGAYKAVGSKAFAVLTGDPITRNVCGYYAMDANGYGASTELYTWVPDIYGHCSFIVFAYEDNTQVTVEYTDTGVDIATFTLNKGEHWQNESLSEKWLHVTANKPVSALTAYDQGYFVPSANKSFSGTEFYTYVSDIQGWAQDLSVMAFHDNTTVTIKNSDTSSTIWSGTLNSGQSHVESYPTGADIFFSITSSKTVTVSVQPWVSETLAYAQGAYIPDSTGAGIGTDLIGSTLSSGYLYIFAYEDSTTVQVHNSQTGVLASTHNLDEGDYVNAIPGNGLWRITSNRPVSAYSGNGLYNADFAPVQFGEVVTTLQVTPDPTTVNVGQSTSVELLVKDYGLPVETALVTLSGCGVSESGYTNASGIVNLNVLATGAGTINVAASKGVKTGTAEIQAVAVVPGPTVMMASNYGDGRVVVVGDGSMFTSGDADSDGTINLDEYDNEKVAVDIPVWLCGLTAGPIDIPLAAGWNLISLPLIPANTDIDSVISDSNLTGGDAGNIDTIYWYDPATDTWIYRISGTGPLTTMEDGKGYWVYATVADTLTIHGREAASPGPDYPVLADWNMVGFTSISDMALVTYLASVYPNYSTVYRWDADTEEWSWWMSGSSNFNTMNPGYGYWLYMTTGGTITPP